MRWLDGVTDSTDMQLSKLWEMVEDRGAQHAAVHGVTKSRTPLSCWTTTSQTSDTNQQNLKTGNLLVKSCNRHWAACGHLKNCHQVHQDKISSEKHRVLWWAYTHTREQGNMFSDSIDSQRFLLHLEFREMFYNICYKYYTTLNCAFLVKTATKTSYCHSILQMAPLWMRWILMVIICSKWRIFTACEVWSLPQCTR